ncbi:putative wound-induced protein Wun1 [Helianthus anomalus]
MMRLLTGTDNLTDSFEFVPRSIDTFGSTVIVEGCDQSRDISWIHAWWVLKLTRSIIIQHYKLVQID